MTALDYAIVVELEERELEAQQLRVELHQRGHDLSTVRLYERLVHLEAQSRVRVVAKCRGDAKWAAV